MVGLNFVAGKEGDTMDWAARVAHGHGYMGNELTDRGCLGHNIVGQVISGNCNKRKQGKNTPIDGSTGRQRTTTATNVKDELQVNSDII